jgi:hypothetical protein
MRFEAIIVPFGLALLSVSARTIQDGCPKNEYACIDVINSSQCIEQLVIEKQAPVTKESLAKCVEYEGTASNIPGAAKVSAISAHVIVISTMYWKVSSNIVNSSVDVQAATLPRSMKLFKSCSPLHVTDGDDMI